MGYSSVPLSGFKGLRSDLLVALRKEQPLTAKELGARFGLTANAFRRHLKELGDAGLVRFRREVRGVGGPEYAYSLTERGEQLFPRSYASPLADALEVVRAEQGSEGVVRIFRRRWQAVADAANSEFATVPLAERARAVAAMLTDNGYMAESEAASPHAVLIRVHNCALGESAQQFPEVCSAEAAFIGLFQSARKPVPRDLRTRIEQAVALNSALRAQTPEANPKITLASSRRRVDPIRPPEPVTVRFFQFAAAGLKAVE